MSSDTTVNSQLSTQMETNTDMDHPQIGDDHLIDYGLIEHSLICAIDYGTRTWAMVFEHGLYLPCENYPHATAILAKLLQRFLSVSYITYGLENTQQWKAYGLDFSSGSITG